MTSMIKTFRFVTSVFPALALATALVPAVHAGCGDISTLQAPFAFAQAGVDAQALVQRAAEATRASAISAASGGEAFNTATMVGMWISSSFPWATRFTILPFRTAR
jgi:hypothetical protein